MKPLLVISSFSCGLLFSGLVCADQLGLAFFPDGRSINLGYSVPYRPTDPKECAQLSLRIDKLKQQISEAHSECLKSYPGGGRSNYLGKHPCSAPACQSLHTAGADISSRDEVSECYRQVDAARSKAPATASGGEDFTHEIRAIASGPKSALVVWIRDKMASSISHVFGTHGPSEQVGRAGVARVREKDSKLALGVAGGTAKLYSTANALYDACKSAGASVAAVCQAEIKESVQNLSRRVPAQMRSDPAVRLIQSAMLERLASIQRQTMASISDTLAKAGDSEFKVIDREEFANQPPAGQAADPQANDRRSEESQALVRSRQDAERRMVAEGEERVRAYMERQEQRDQERQQLEMQRQRSESPSGSRRSSRSEDTKSTGGCWSNEAVCPSSDSKCIAKHEARRARLPRCKGG